MKKMKEKAYLIFSLFMICACMAICPVKAKAEDAVLEPSLSAEKLTIAVKDKVTITLNDVESGKVKWTTSNKKIAKLKANGKNKQNVTITAKKTGSVKIKAKYNGKVYTCKVVVKKNLLSSSEITVLTGESGTLTLKNAKGTLKWKSSSKGKVSVSSDSKDKKSSVVKGLKPGKATVSVKYKGKKYKCKVTVQNPGIEKEKLDMALTDQPTLSFPYVTDTVTWSVKDNSNISIKPFGTHNENISIKAKDTGSTTIRAEYKGKVYSCKVSVRSVKITQSQSDITLNVGNKEKIRLSNTTNTVTWSVLDDSIVTIETEGDNNRFCNITAKKVGKTDVIATYNDVTYTCHVTVNAGSGGADHEHEWDEGILIKDSGCAQKGLIVYTCQICNIGKNEYVKEKEHEYETGWTVDVAATCTKEGSKSHHCTRCGNKKDVTVIEKADHDLEVTSFVSCTQEGYTEYQCRNCDYERKEQAIIGHDYEEEWTIDKQPTCAEDGSKSHHCTRCDAKKDVTSIPALEHSYTVTSTKKCTEDGFIVYTCDICDYFYSEIDYATDHKVSNGYCVVCQEYVPGLYNHETGQMIKKWDELVSEYGINPSISKNVETYKSQEDSLCNIFENNGLSGDIYLPASVLVIGDYAFADCSTLTGIYIHPQVHTIGVGAFKNCENVEKITGAGDITLIEMDTFKGCKKLQSFAIPLGVDYIGTSAFEGCESMGSIAIPATLTTIETNTFQSCKNLTDIKIPASVTEIKTSAFSECDSLKTVAMPASLEKIGSHAFYNCKSLETMELPQKVTIIPEYLFYNCTNLTAVLAKGDVTEIGANAFAYCEALNAFEIPDTVTSIGTYAFAGCKNLPSATIPEGVKAINSYTFFNCSNLKEVNLSDNIQLIGDYAFSESGIEGIYIGSDTIQIGSCALYHCQNLTTLSIPNTVLMIGDKAFGACGNLTSVTWGTTEYTQKEQLNEALQAEGVCSSDVW